MAATVFDDRVDRSRRPARVRAFGEELVLHSQPDWMDELLGNDFVVSSFALLDDFAKLLPPPSGVANHDEHAVFER